MSGYIRHISILHSHVFLLNSRLGLFSAASLSPDWRPLSRSYRTILPSSLTVNHSSASVFSTQLRVSVYGTGTLPICLADFLGSMVTLFLPCASTRHTVRFDSRGGFAYLDQRLHPLTIYSVRWPSCHFSVSTSLAKVVWEY